MKMYVEAEQVSLFAPDTWSGKTSPERSVPTAERTSRQSSKKPSASSAKKRPLFLCLMADGRTPDASLEWVTAESPFPSPGDYTTRSFGECPSEENASRLSQILEVSVPKKYYLSAKACQWILNRAERRGKKLPEALETVLKAQTVSQTGDIIPGDVTETLRSDPHGAYPCAVSEPCQPSTTSPSSTGNGAERAGEAAVAYGINSYNSGAMKSANPRSGIYEADTSRTLDNNGGNPACNQGGIAVVASVDVRNGKENECVNGTLQSKPNGGTSLNLNNVVRVRRE